MATKNEDQVKKKENVSTSSKGNQEKGNKSNNVDQSKKDSSNVGKGPSGENL